jgi:hypothetical protein
MCAAGATHPTNIADLDALDQADVLREVLGIYPETLTLDELVRELTVASTTFTEVDRIQRAVRVLTAGGLLHRIGALVLPTRAAVNFHDLPRA